jgi:predicted nucleic acid-binding protein
MITVSNATPLIGLASIGRFDLLRQIFGEITIAQAVFDETVTKGRESGGAKLEVARANWVSVVPVKDRLAVAVLLDELDAGEAETIVLARELNADWVLMDEKKGRRKLTELGLPKIGTLGILLKAKQANLIPNIQPEIVKLRENSISLSQHVIEAVLRQAGE